MNLFRRKKIDSVTTRPDVEDQRTTLYGASTAMEQLSVQVRTNALKRETILDYNEYNENLSQLRDEIKTLLDITDYRSRRKVKTKSGRRTLETAHKKLQQYKDIIKGKQESLKDEQKTRTKSPGLAATEVSISGAEIQELLRRRNDRKGGIQRDIKEGQAGKLSDTAPWPNESIEQIKKSQTVDEKHHKAGQKLNKGLGGAASSRIESNNQAMEREILQGIANNSLTEPQINYYLANMGQLAPIIEQHGLTDQAHNLIQTRGGRYSASVSRYKSMDSETAYRTGGVLGRLNNVLMKGFPNAKPEHIGTLTTIAAATSGIYAIFKAGKRALGKDAEGNRNIRKAGALGAAIQFVPALFTGQGGFSLIGDILSGKADFGELRYRLSNCLRFLNNGDPEVYRQVTPGILGMSIIPQHYTVANLRSMQEEFSNSPQARSSWYDSTYKRLSLDTSALASEFQNTFTHRDTYDPSEWTAFRGKVGIDNNTKPEAIVFNEVAKTAEKGDAFQRRMKSQGKKKNPAFETAIDEYLKAPGEFNPDDLDQDNRFETDTEAAYTMREVDSTDKEKLEEKVDGLSLDEDKKAKLKDALKQFYDARTIGSKPIVDKFNLSISADDNLILESNEEQCIIDLTARQIQGFGSSITFADLQELINVADLSNKILQTQKNKTCEGLPPFEYRRVARGGRGIYFNDKSGRNLDFDTRVLSGGRGGTIGSIETLNNHPDDYASYLSERWISAHKYEVNKTKYPKVGALAENNIIFFNESEVKKLDNLLTTIKANYGTSDSKESAPFSIKGDNLYFTDENGNEIEIANIKMECPSLLLNGNKDKFLYYINKKDNGMWSGTIIVSS